MTTLERINKAYAWRGLPPLVPSQTLVALGFDDLDSLEFVMSLEDEFAMEIPDEEAPSGLTSAKSWLTWISAVTGITIRIEEDNTVFCELGSREAAFKKHLDQLRRFHEFECLRYDLAISGAMRWPWSQEASIASNPNWRIL